MVEIVDPVSGEVVAPRKVTVGLFMGLPCLIDHASGAPLELGDGLEIKVPVSRRTWSHPFKAVRTPWVPAYFLTNEHAGDEVPSKNYLCRDHSNRTPSHELIHRQQVSERLVVIWQLLHFPVSPYIPAANSIVLDFNTMIEQLYIT